MKVCFLTDTIYAHGGVARVVTTIANKFSEKHKVTIICTDNIKDKENIYFLDKEKVKVVNIGINYKKISYVKFKVCRFINNRFKCTDKKKFNKFIIKSFFPEMIQKQFISYINDSKFDIVVGCHAYYTFLLGAISEKITSKNIGWQHSMYEAYFGTKHLYMYNKKQVFRYILSQLDANVVLTNHDKEQYKRFLDSDSIRIYNPLVIEPTINPTTNNNQILTIGRLNYCKGFDNLIDAIKIVKNKFQNIKLVIVGDGAERRNLEEKIKENMLHGNVKLVGFKSDVNMYYNEANVYVCSSRWEGFPLTPIEAMSCELPIVSTNIPSAKELLDDEKYGLICEVGDVLSLANKIMEMLESENLQYYKKQSILRSKDFNIDKIVNEWESLFEMIVESKE